MGIPRLTAGGTIHIGIDWPCGGHGDAADCPTGDAPYASVYQTLVVNADDVVEGAMEHFVNDGSEPIDWALERLIPWVRERAPQAQAVDVVPEPIDPPTVGSEGQALEPAGSEEALVLPVALQGLRTGESGLEIVVFAAADDETGPAYDGFFIRQVPNGE